MVNEDHTPGDVNGYYMLVNSSYNPGDFYVSTVNNLCGGTTYEFAAWILNVLRPSASGIKPNVTFTIETTAGTILQSFSTGDILETQSAVWKQYGFFFQTPANVTSVVIRMKNNAPGGAGNDLALDDITFRPCGAKVDVSVQNYGTQKNISVCENGNQQFNIQTSLSSGVIVPGYQWQSSNNGTSWTDMTNQNGSSLTVNLSAAGTYYYRVAIAEAINISSTACRTNSEIVQIRINPKPNINLTDTVNACAGDTVQITITGAASQTWTGPSGFNSTQSSIQVSNVQNNNAGKYYVIATSTDACSVTDSLQLNVHPLPNVNAGNDTVACSGQSIQLTGSGQGTLIWSLNGTTIGNGANVTTTVNQNSVFTLTATDQNGCKNVDAKLVQALASPTANAGADKEIMQGDSVVLNGQAKGDGINFYWSPLSFLSPDTSLTPTVKPPQDIIYTLTVESAACGIVSDDVFVKVFKQLYVPNVFTPNGDGTNDTWVIEGIQTYADNVVQVFNRYGQKVFESNGYSSPWNGTAANGKPLPAGTYYYLIDTKKTTRKYAGWIMILR